MSRERKRHFIEELKRHYAELIASARDAEVAAAEAAETLRLEAKRREDTKGAVEFGRIAGAHKDRRERARRELETLIAFAAGGLASLPRSAKIRVGALVDVSIDDAGATEERTFFVLPVGAGSELTGPGGDGFITVVTPESPVGRGLVGACVGDSFETSIGGRDREWTIVDVC